MLQTTASQIQPQQKGKAPNSSKLTQSSQTPDQSPKDNVEPQLSEVGCDLDNSADPVRQEAEGSSNAEKNQNARSRRLQKKNTIILKKKINL